MSPKLSHDTTLPKLAYGVAVVPTSLDCVCTQYVLLYSNTQTAPAEILLVKGPPRKRQHNVPPELSFIPPRYTIRPLDVISTAPPTLAAPTESRAINFCFWVHYNGLVYEDDDNNDLQLNLIV